MLEVGVKAPDFTLKDKDGKEVALSSFRGKKVVLYFYPKDNTPGCTRQACAFAGAYAGFKEECGGYRGEQGQREIPCRLCSQT